MRRVEEKPLRRHRDDDVRVAQVQREVAPPVLLILDRRNQALVAREGMAEDQFAPAAVDARLLGERLAAIAGLVGAPRLDRDARCPGWSLHPQLIVCVWSQASSAAICQSFEPF